MHFGDGTDKIKSDTQPLTEARDETYSSMMQILPLADEGTTSSITIILYCGVLIVICVIGALLVLWIRRRLFAKSDAPDGTGFSLGDLRELHKTGKMSTEEFNKARDQIVAAAKRALERDAALKAKKDATDR